MTREQKARALHARERAEMLTYLQELRAHLVSHPARARLDTLALRIYGCGLAMGDAYRVMHPGERVD